MPSSTASRARSWRNASVSPRRSSRPASMQASIAAAPLVTSVSSVAPGTTAHSSTTSRAASSSALTRKATASRTLAGISPAGAASASVTKNGLPPVTACRSAASRPAARASCATASADSGVGLDPAHALARERGQHAADLGQRLAAAGEDQAAGRAHEPAAEQRDEVERRVVGPVQVLDHEHGAGGELVERGVEHGLAAAVDRPPAACRRPRGRRRAAGRAGAA